ncbi:hypothetical protein GCM10023317_45930 [Actinopolymorpha pittospori]|uniref:Uncharacterized protein n=1 Tax=Actinopolymorpha pittospori TaxID=648752 RepID=A0A927MML2_9ACTN|nr:hypothetical protein [Actinopolymorpha pittospori]
MTWWAPSRADQAHGRVVGDRPAVVAGLRHHRVHSFQDSLRDRVGTGEPGWGGQDEDLCRQDLFRQARPLVFRPEFRLHAGWYVKDDDSNVLDVRPEVPELVHDHGRQASDVGSFGGRLTVRFSTTTRIRFTLLEDGVSGPAQ